MENLEKGRLYGIPVTLSPYGVIEKCLDRAVRNKEACVSVMTMSFPMVGAYEKNSDYSRAIGGSDIVLPDGTAIVLLFRYLGSKIIKRLTGPDFFLRFSGHAQKREMSYFFLGSTEDTLQKIRARMAEEFPGIRVAGTYSPPFGDWGPQDDEKMVAAVNRSGADFLWVGITAPRQEIWIAKNRSVLQVGAVAAVGASFDFFAKTRKRAPLWMQKSGLEWLYRIFQEPWRMGVRYFGAVIPFFRLALRHRRKRNAAGS